MRDDERRGGDEAFGTSAGGTSALRRMTGVAAAVLIVVAAALLAFHWKLGLFPEVGGRAIFPTCKYPRGDWTAGGVLHEDVSFDSADGTRLHGWLFLSGRPGPVVLFCHGNGGNVTTRWRTMHMLREDLGCTVLVFDYRGYGKSEGTPTSRGIVADAEAARAWLAERCGVPEDEIVLIGRSLGGAVALELADELPPPKLVLQSTFASLRGVARHHVGPLASLLGFDFDSLPKIARYRGPLLMSHGTADEVIPLFSGRKLFEAANEPKELFLIDGGTHNVGGPPEYDDRLRQFLADR